MSGTPQTPDSPGPDELLLEISLAGVFDQGAIGPRNLPFPDLERFPREVAQFVIGSNQASMAATSVEIKEGSIRLAFRPPVTVQESLRADLESLASGMANLRVTPDPERSKILNRWQRRASMEEHYSFTVSMGRSTITINSSTNWKLPETEETSSGEYMVLGEVDDAGGDSPNIHVVDSASKERLIVAASREQIREESHPVYNRKLLHVSAERSLRTGKLKKVRLIRFVGYAPSVDEDCIRLMMEQGTEIFGKVKDAGEWIRKKRDASDAA